MKYKSYKDSNRELTTGLETELLDKNDIISARNINRPIINLEENQETDYNLLQTLLKAVYGDRNGILPDVQEEFIPETFQIGSFSNDTSKYFIRLPLGSMFLSKDPGDEFNINDRNPFSAQGEYNYKDAYGKDSFLNDKLHSYIIENKPEINLYERQLANFIGLDLTYLDNDVKIFEDLIPFTIKVAIIDEDTHKIKNNSEGSPMYMQDEDSNTIYLAKEGEGDLDIFINDTIVNPENFDFVTNYNTILNSKTESLTNDTILQYVDYNERLTTKKTPNGRYTSDINKAVVLKDSNGETKYRSGYYMEVVRSTDADNEETYLPNLAENAKFEIFMPSYSGSKVNVEVKITDENNKTVESFKYAIFEDNDFKTANENFYSAAYEYLKKFNVTKIQRKLSNNDIIIGSKIVSKSSNEVTNNYKISIKYVDVDNNQETFVVDPFTDRFIEDVDIIKKVNQKYFDNVFDLTNSFLGHFSSFTSSVENIYNYINFETIIPILPLEIGELYIYYDLNGNVDNQLKENYDKTGRFFTSDSVLHNNKYIKLFSVKYTRSDSAPYSYKISNVTSYMSNLDRRTISTKRAELSTLLVNSRTDLRNYFLLRDNDGNRTIELTENFDTPDKEQVRYASPITRITDKIETTKLEEQDENTWEDYANGDTPSDFFEDAYPVRNFITDEKYYNQHNDYSNKGIIIDRNKGLKIFNNSGLINYPYIFGELDKENTTNSVLKYKNYTKEFENLTPDEIKNKIDEKINNSLIHSSYSYFQPLEISSKVGNINILTTDYNYSRINIKNIKDSNNNIIDLFGITRVRSANRFQLIVRKISNLENVSASIAFVTGSSTSKEDNDAINYEKNINAGYLGYRTGFNNFTNNRTFNIFLAIPNTQGVETEAVQEQKPAFEIRNSYTSGGYFTSTFHGDIVGYGDNNFIGYPLLSRTYSEENIIPYKKDLDFLNAINSEGTIDRRNSTENRWLASFIKYGYFGKITLADRVSDIINKDSRDGVLRLGNSNIFDVSSIYINQTNGRLNFDNKLNIYSENTIRSYYNEEENKDGFDFILNRILEGNLSNSNYHKENRENYIALRISPTGSYINKNLNVSRQVFINDHNRSSVKDNSSLVVTGQTLANGELIINSNKGIVNDTNYDTITRDTDDKKKYYDFEYFQKHNYDGNTYDQRAYNEETKKYLAKNKDANLFSFVNIGKSYFSGNIKVDGVFESDATFNKTVIINNNRVANYKYNEFTDNIPTGESEYFGEDLVDSNDKYYNNNVNLPRNHEAFKVVSGRVVFGSGYSDILSEKDSSDVIVNGTQFIRRRLEISEEDSILLNTKKVYNRLINTYTKKTGMKYYASELEDSHNSPDLFVNGSAHIAGDVVFGNNPKSRENYYYLPNKKEATNSSNPIKAIFWGANDPTVTLGEGSSSTKDWRTDFDFHGKTWFDNIVKIGSKTDELCRVDSNEGNNSENGRLVIYGKDGTALEVEGSVNISKGEDFDINSENVSIVAQTGDKYSSINMSGEEEDFNLEVESGLKTFTMSPEKILLSDKTAESIKIESKNGSSNSGSDIELRDKKITINADDNIDASTSETTIISGNNVINAKDDTFISQINNNNTVVNEISQTKKDGKETIKLFAKNNTGSTPSGNIELETYNYLLNAHNDDYSEGSITENTKNRSITVSDKYTEKETNYENTASNSWKVSIKNAENDNVSKTLLGNSNSFKFTHGTSYEEINSSLISLNTASTYLKFTEAAENSNVELKTVNGSNDVNVIKLSSNLLNIFNKKKTTLYGSQESYLSVDRNLIELSVNGGNRKISIDDSNNSTNISGPRDNISLKNGSGTWKEDISINLLSASETSGLKLEQNIAEVKANNANISLVSDNSITLQTHLLTNGDLNKFTLASDSQLIATNSFEAIITKQNASLYNKINMNSSGLCFKRVDSQYTVGLDAKFPANGTEASVSLTSYSNYLKIADSKTDLYHTSEIYLSTGTSSKSSVQIKPGYFNLTNTNSSGITIDSVAAQPYFEAKFDSGYLKLTSDDFEIKANKDVSLYMTGGYSSRISLDSDGSQSRAISLDTQTLSCTAENINLNSTTVKCDAMTLVNNVLTLQQGTINIHKNGSAVAAKITQESNGTIIDLSGVYKVKFSDALYVENGVLKINNYAVSIS